MPRSGQMLCCGGEDGAGGAGGAGGEVGRMVDCSQADDRRMIRLVRARRLLYARNNMPVASYYTQVKTLWEEVAAEMGWTVADVRRKWSRIRNSYSRHLRNETAGARTGRGRHVSRWYLADELEFLRDHMATDTRASPYSYAPTFLEVDLGEPAAHALPEPLDVKPFLHSPWLALAGARAAPPCAGGPDSPGPRGPAAPHNEDSSHAFGPDENSSYFQFFRGIYSDYEELSARQQRVFKRQCLGALHRLLDAAEAADGAEAADAADGADAPAAGLLLYGQSGAINLSNSAHASDDEKEQGVCVVEKIENYCILPNQ